MTWYQERPTLSLSLVAATGFGADAAVVDVGGGSSRLVDHLLDRGYTDVTVFDLPSTHWHTPRRRLGDRAGEVTWIVGDVLEHRFDPTIDVWHDRAVFHFLTEPADRERYVHRLDHAVAPGGHVIVATLGLNGPDRCSGLPEQRYGPETLSQTLATGFEPVGFQNETHLAPTGATQPFLYGHFQRRSNRTTDISRRPRRRLDG